MWHKKDAALFEYHMSKRNGNKSKMAKYEAISIEVVAGECGDA